MKILFIHQYVGSILGGTERHIKELAYNFYKRGHQVEILTAKRKNIPLFKDEKIKITKLPTIPFNEEKYFKWLFKLFYHLKIRINSFIILSCFWILFKYFKGERWDIISVHWIDEAFLIRKLNRLLKYPYVFILEGYTYEEAEEAKLSSKCITISNFIAENCNKIHGYKPIVIPLGIDINKFYKYNNTNDIYSQLHINNSMAILSVGRLVERKDYLYIIEAADIVLKENTNVNFFIIGEGPDRIKLQKKIDELKINNKIYLLGNISDDDLPKYYNGCDIFLHYPYIQQFEIVNIEAMACGKPIIGSDSGAAREVLGDAAILVQKRNIEELANAILKLIEDKDLMIKLSENALKRINNYYKWDYLIEKYENEYLNCIKSNCK